jgi:hypothetical protein
MGQGGLPITTHWLPSEITSTLALIVLSRSHCGRPVRLLLPQQSQKRSKKVSHDYCLRDNGVRAEMWAWHRACLTLKPLIVTSAY